MTLQPHQQVHIRLPAGPAIALHDAAQRGAQQLVNDAYGNPGLQEALASVLEGLEAFSVALDRAENGET